jgi:hypothetical protein
MLAEGEESNSSGVVGVDSTGPGEQAVRVKAMTRVPRTFFIGLSER